MNDPQSDPFSALLSYARSVGAPATPATFGDRVKGAAQNLYQGATGALLEGDAAIYKLAGAGLSAVGLDSAGQDLSDTAQGLATGRTHDVITGALGQPSPALQNDSGLMQTFTTDLPRMVGGAVGMFGVPGPPSMGAVGVGVRGALVNGASGYYEALAHGADDTKAWTSFVGNALLGATAGGLPGLPESAVVRLGSILGRANKATGGGLGEALYSGVKTGLAQVGYGELQQIGSNVVAHVLYDDDRKFLEGALPVLRGSALFGLFAGALAAPHGEAADKSGRTPDKIAGQNPESGSATGAPEGDPLASTSQGPVTRPRLSLEQLPPEHAQAVKDMAAGSQALGWQGEVHPVEPHEVADNAMRNFVERRGARVQLVEAADGQPLPRPAMYSKDGGIVTIDVNSPDAFSSLVDHEIGHHVLESVEGQRESFQAAIDRIAPELRAQAAEEYRADLVRQSQRQAGRDLTSEEVAQLQAQPVPHDESLTRIAEDFSPVVRLLRSNPEAFSKVDDVGFWRKTVNAVLNVGRTLTGRDKVNPAEQRLAEVYRSIARTPLASKIEPARGIEIAHAVRDFLDSAVGTAQKPVGEVPGGNVLPADVTEAVTKAVTGVTTPGHGIPEPDATLAPHSRHTEVETARAKSLLRFTKADLESIRDERLASEQRTLREEHPGHDDAWYARVEDLRRQARDPENLEGDRAALQLKRAGIEPSGSNVEEILDALRTKAKASEGPRGQFGQAIKAGEENIGKGPQYAVARGTPLQVQQANRARSYLQDALNPVKKLVEAAKRAGLLTDENNVYQKEELRRGKTKDRLDREYEAHVKPLIDALKKSGLDVDDAELYLMARHAPERNALIEGRTGNANGSGMSDAQAAKIVAQAESGPKAAEYKGIAGKFDALTKRTRELWLEYGLESKDTIDQLERQFSKFAPMRSEPDAEGQPRGPGRQIKGREFKAALGRGSLAENPLIYAAQDLERAIARGEDNRVKQSLYDLAKTVDDPKLMVVDVPPMKDALVNGAVRKVPDFQEAENEVTLKVGGELRRVRFPQEYASIARAIKGLDNETGGKVVEAMGKATRLISGLSTRWNPFFPPVNAVRDVLGATLNAQDRAFLNPRRLASAAKEIATNGPWAQRYRKSGAPVAFLDLYPKIAERAQALRDDVGAMRGELTTWQKTKRGIAPIARAISNMNDVAEGMTRLSAFRHAVEDLGMSEDQAASFAKNVTVNFERKGQAGWINSVYAFSNAGIQGLDRTAQTLAKPGARKLAAALVAGGFALDSMNRATGGEDEDGIPYYDKIPDHIRRGHAIVMLPGSKGDYVKIPLPFVWGWFHVAGAEMARAFDTGNVARAVGETFTSLIDQTNPLGSGGDLVDTLTPSLLDPVVDVARNQNFTGKPIYPDKHGATPDSELTWDGTNQTLVEITRWLNSATGGNRAKSGFVDVSPLTIQHLLSAYGGQVGAEGYRFFSTAEKIAGGDDTTFADYPLWRRFVGEIGPREQHDVFKDNLAPVHEAERLEKLGEPYDERLYRLRLRARSWAEKVNDLDDAIKAAPGPQKADLRKRQLAVMLDAIRVIRETQAPEEQAPVTAQK